MDGCSTVLLNHIPNLSIYIRSNFLLDLNIASAAAGRFVVKTVAYITLVYTSHCDLKDRFLQNRTAGSESVNIWESFSVLTNGFSERLNHFLDFHKLSVWEDLFTFFNTDLCHFLNFFAH